LWDPEKYTKSYITKSGSEEKDTRVKHFADYLYNQLYPAYLTLSDDSKTLSGWNTKNNKNLHDWLEKLYISKNSPTDLDVSIEQMGDIINALAHSELKDAYESTFAPWLVGFDAYEQQ
jgi:DNA phosphorothioation-dependent restriction protein DptG